MLRYKILRPDRLRSIERPFAAVPCRLLTDGHFSRLSAEGRQLYFLLLLAADRNGMSFYSKPRLQQHLCFSLEQLDSAVSELLRLDFIAYQGGAFQVLSLSPPAATQSPIQTISQRQPEPQPIRPAQNRDSPQMPHESSLDDMPYPEDVREIMLKLLGRTSL